jgi:hypothetical protein
MIRHGRLHRNFASFVLVAALASPAAAQDGEPSTAYNGLVGLGAAVCTIVYSPLKVVYAASGLVVTSLAFLWTFGDTEVAGPLWRTTVGGDYVVTPSHLEGRRDLRFRGER